MSATDTVIIGAGPYGLSLAAHLGAAGVPHEIIGRPMHAWRSFMPPGMLLRSEAFASSLFAPWPGYTFRDYCELKGIAYQAVGMHLPLETFAEYGLWFQSRLVPHVREAEVTDVQRVKGGYRVTLDDGTSLDAKRVVMALGLKGYAQTPPVFQGLPEPQVVHSAIFGDLSWSTGKDVTIVGGGQSALGLAALFHEIGARVRVIARETSVTWNDRPVAQRSLLSKLRQPEAGLGPGWISLIYSECPWLFHRFSEARRKRVVETSWGPSGAWWLRDRVVGKIDVLCGTVVREVNVQGECVQLQMDGPGGRSRLSTQHLIIATGFKVDIARQAFLAESIRHAVRTVSGSPVLSANFESSVDGLYVIGPAAAQSFGPVMRFVYGAKYAAPRVAKHIVRAHRRDAKGVGQNAFPEVATARVADDTAPQPQRVFQHSQE
ncbi:NAD(P)-binding domain-containing protein [Paraburkholderia phosphatilytica]|uniref:NAD(P)-binding domain-containing protein n=1 Tax=Paraburkholderia phosphatilytica TaxID=2282883 RepID=UPI000E4BECCD|nr:NAD(P)-binding domain-containing protein [Paraburkholderia phosphatilytica]